jgi:hypothetical protein
MLKLNTRANFKTSSSFWGRLRPYRPHTHCHSQRARVPRRPSSKKHILANRYNNTFGSSNTKFCRQTKLIWRMFMRFKSTTVSSARRMVPTVSNVRMNATSASTFGMVSSRALPWSPICPTILYVPGNFVPGMFEDVPLYVTQRLWVQHGKDQTRYRKDVWQWFRASHPRRWTGRAGESYELGCHPIELRWNFSCRDSKERVYAVPSRTAEDLLTNLQAVQTTVHGAFDKMPSV